MREAVLKYEQQTVKSCDGKLPDQCIQCIETEYLAVAEGLLVQTAHRQIVKIDALQFTDRVAQTSAGR